MCLLVWIHGQDWHTLGGRQGIAKDDAELPLIVSVKSKKMPTIANGAVQVTIRRWHTIQL